MRKLENQLKLKISGNYFSAMDYHLDWLEISLKLWSNKIELGKKFVNSENHINSNQEDIDYIIAFGSNDNIHIVLIEAKGVTGWTNKQMDSKAKRFKELFGNDGSKVDGVTPHFLYVFKTFWTTTG